MTLRLLHQRVSDAPVLLVRRMEDGDTVREFVVLFAADRSGPVEVLVAVDALAAATGTQLSGDRARLRVALMRFQQQIEQCVREAHSSGTRTIMIDQVALQKVALGASWPDRDAPHITSISSRNSRNSAFTRRRAF